MIPGLIGRVAPGHICGSVVRVNQATIALDGEAFYKQVQWGAARRAAGIALTAQLE